MTWDASSDKAAEVVDEVGETFPSGHAGLTMVYCITQVLTNLGTLCLCWCYTYYPMAMSMNAMSMYRNSKYMPSNLRSSVAACDSPERSEYCMRALSPLSLSVAWTRAIALPTKVISYTLTVSAFVTKEGAWSLWSYRWLRLIMKLNYESITRNLWIVI